jgi:hypothetical protein
MIEICGTTFARAAEIERDILVRRFGGFHVIVDVRSTEDNAVRLWLEDGSTITVGSSGLVEVAQRAIHDSMISAQPRVRIAGAPTQVLQALTVSCRQAIIVVQR